MLKKAIMPEDIVERLRMEAKYFGGAARIEDVMREAADEIWRLRDEAKTAEVIKRAKDDEIERLRAEIEVYKPCERADEGTQPSPRKMGLLRYIFGGP